MKSERVTNKEFSKRVAVLLPVEMSVTRRGSNLKSFSQHVCERQMFMYPSRMGVSRMLKVPLELGP